MSITAYVGLPGHGKSYGVVQNVIKPALEKKRKVFTNIPMNLEVCKSKFGIEPVIFETQDIIDNPNWWEEKFEHGALIVIDECWRLWPAGTSVNKFRVQDKAFLAEHRHQVGENGLSTEIVLVTQDLSQIANFARSLVENTYRVIKLSSIGASKKFRVDIYYGSVTGASPPVSKRHREIYGNFSKEIYQLYQSHTKSETGQAGDESRIDNRFNILKGTSIKVGFVAVIVIGYFCYNGFLKVSSYYGVSDTGINSTSVNASSSDISSSTDLPSDNSVKKQQIKTVNQPPKFIFLSKAKSIHIVFNNGHYPNIEYKFSVNFEDMSATFTELELSTLDYKIVSVNDCFVRINGPDYSGFAMCKKDNENKNWVESLVQPASHNQEI